MGEGAAVGKRARWVERIARLHDIIQCNLVVIVEDSGVRDSTKILIVVLIALGAVLFGFGYTRLLVESIDDDARVVNQVGILRGTIQRIVKLEFANRDNQGEIALVDQLLADSLVYDIEAGPEEQASFRTRAREMHATWQELKLALQTYRVQGDDATRDRLVAISERIWDQSNDLVLFAQRIAEGKVVRFRVPLVVLAGILLLMLVLFFAIELTVRRKLEVMATRDALTKTFSRKPFDIYLVRKIEKARRWNQDLSLIMFDLDHFKAINDTYGHDVGDRILTELTEVVTGHLLKDDIFARWGGEEFVILAPERDLSQALSLAERIRAAIANHTFPVVGRVTISVGVAQLQIRDNASSLLQRADKGLYQAKENGRNQCVAS